MSDLSHRYNAIRKLGERHFNLNYVIDYFYYINILNLAFVTLGTVRSSNQPDNQLGNHSDPNSYYIFA